MKNVRNINNPSRKQKLNTCPLLKDCCNQIRKHHRTPQNNSPTPNAIKKAKHFL